MTSRTFSRRTAMKTGAALATLPIAGAAAPVSRPSTTFSRAQDLEAAELDFYFGGNPEEAKTRQKIIDAFMQKFPQIKINARVAEGDPVQELQVQFAGGGGPDIMMAWELTYSGLASRSIFADLNEFITADAEFANVVKTDHLPELVGMFNSNGAQYALPEQYAGVVLFYNKAHFAEAGVAPPPADWTDASWTWDSFLKTAQALTVMEGDRVSRFGFADAWWTPLSAMVIATGNGGTWFDQYVNPTACTIADPKITEGVQWYADLANVHHVAPTAEEVSAQAGVDMFMGGRASMCLVGHWMYPAFSAVDGLEFEVGVLPVGPGGTTPKSDLGSTGLGISNSTEHKEQAWEFVKFSTGPEGQALIAQSGLFVPVLKSVGQSESYLNAHPKIANATVFTDALQNSIALPITPKWSEIAAIWERETNKVLQGKASAADVHAQLEGEINDLLG